MKLIFSLEQYKKYSKDIPQWAIDLDGAIVDFSFDSDWEHYYYGKERLYIKKDWCIK